MISSISKKIQNYRVFNDKSLLTTLQKRDWIEYLRENITSAEGFQFPIEVVLNMVFGENHGWKVSFDEGLEKSLCYGRCSYDKKLISFPYSFIKDYLEIDKDLVIEIVLHEIAHALEWTHFKTSGHEERWKRFCNLLGISKPRATYRVDWAKGKSNQYFLQHPVTKKILAGFSYDPHRFYDYEEENGARTHLILITRSEAKAQKLVSE